MTQKQIDAAKKTLPRRYDYKSWTDEQKRLDDELDCREMINSCLAYGWITDFWYEREDFIGRHSYADPYIRSLGIARVRQLAAEQEADFAKARVIHGCYTDSEDCSYNSVVWADEMQ